MPVSVLYTHRKGSFISHSSCSTLSWSEYTVSAPHLTSSRHWKERPCLLFSSNQWLPVLLFSSQVFFLCFECHFFVIFPLSDSLFDSTYEFWRWRSKLQTHWSLDYVMLLNTALEQSIYLRFCQTPVISFLLLKRDLPFKYCLSSYSRRLKIHCDSTTETRDGRPWRQIIIEKANKKDRVKASARITQNQVLKGRD